MESRKGFTLVELMVVILIVGILAAVAIPIMRGRIDSAKWSEGRSMIGTIASAIRAYAAERVSSADDEALLTGLEGYFGTWGTKLGFKEEDFVGSYFKDPTTQFNIASCELNDTTGKLEFLIKCTNNSLTPNWYSLDEEGTWDWGDTAG